MRAGVRGRAADDVRVQLCHFVAGVLPAGEELRRRNGGDGAGHVLEDHSRLVLHVDGHAAAQVLRGHAGVREERARVRGVRADRGRAVPRARAARRRLQGRVPADHRAHQRAATGAHVPRAEPRHVHSHVPGAHVRGEREHVPGRDAVRGAVPRAGHHVRRRQPRPGAAGRRDRGVPHGTGVGGIGGGGTGGGGTGGNRHGVRRGFLPARARPAVRGQRGRSAAHQAPIGARRRARAQRPVRHTDGLVAVHPGRHGAVRHLLRGVQLRRGRLPAVRVHLHVVAPVLPAVLHDRHDGPRHHQAGGQLGNRVPSNGSFQTNPSWVHGDINST